MTLEEVRVLIDVPAGAVGDVLSEEELLRLRRTYAGTVTLVDRWLGELFEALRASGPARRLAPHLHVRPGGAAGRARLRPAVPPLALRGADPHPADRPDAEGRARRVASPGDRADGRPPPDHPLGARAPAQRSGPRPRPAPLDPRRTVQGPRLCLPGDGRRGVRDPDPPLAPDRAGRGRPRRASIHRTLPQARGPLGPERRRRRAPRGRRPARTDPPPIRRSDRPGRHRRTPAAPGPGRNSIRSTDPSDGGEGGHTPSPARFVSSNNRFNEEQPWAGRRTRRSCRPFGRADAGTDASRSPRRRHPGAKL